MRPFPRGLWSRTTRVLVLSSGLGALAADDRDKSNPAGCRWLPSCCAAIEKATSQGVGGVAGRHLDQHEGHDVGLGW